MATQVLLRLPDELAARLSHVVAPRQRNRYLVDLLHRELGRESGELEQAARRLNAIEAKSAVLRSESSRWLKAPLDPVDDDRFDADTFERQFAAARSTRATASAVNRVPAVNQAPSGGLKRQAALKSAAKPVVKSAVKPELKPAARRTRRSVAVRPRAIAA